MMNYIRKLVFLSVLTLVVIAIIPSKGGVAEEYEDVPSHTKTVVITNTTQTDISFELFDVSKWGKLISNLTWDGESGDALDVRVNFWTVELNDAKQADYGDLGYESLSKYTDFPKVSSHECKLYWVDDEDLPVTIYYEIDKTKNPDHEIDNSLTLVVKYYDLMGEDATREAPAVGLPLTLFTLGIFVFTIRRRSAFKIRKN